MSFNTLWFGALVGRSFPWDMAVVAAICNETYVCRSVLCGTERLTGGSKGGGAPLAIVLLNPPTLRASKGPEASRSLLLR